MIIMTINNDDNNWKTNYDSGDQTITIFQTMHYRESLISGKPKFLALTHVLVYRYCDDDWLDGERDFDQVT